MKVSEFKSKIPNPPALPDELPDDYPIEQYLVDLFKHGAFIQAGQTNNDNYRQFRFSINEDGEVRASLTVPVSLNM